MPCDLIRTDEYPDQIVPDADVETCLKVLRTIRNACLGPHFFDADGAVILSHAHAKIVDLVRATEGGAGSGLFISVPDTPPLPGTFFGIFPEVGLIRNVTLLRYTV